MSWDIRSLTIIATILLFGFAGAETSQAQQIPQDRNIGVGVMLGEPAGLTFKRWTGANDALALGTAWSFRGDTDLHIHLDYLRHDFQVLEVSPGSMPVFYGIGGRVSLGTADHVGARIPVGISYIFEDTPLEIYLEIAPIVDLLPETAISANGNMGIRFYLN